MKIIDLAQGSPEWLAWREEGLGASTAAILAGVSPYKTRWRLWMELRFAVTNGAAGIPPQDLSSNPLVRHGKENEDRAREAWEDQMNAVILPACGEHDDKPIFRSSFDGLTDQREPVELKCPSRVVFEDARDNGVKSSAFILYEPQVQAQMLVSGAAKGWLVLWLEGEPLVILEVVRNDEWIAAYVADAEAFWQSVVDGQEPPMDPARDLWMPQSPEEAAAWAEKTKVWRTLDHQIKNLEDALKALKGQRDSVVLEMTNMMGSFAAADADGIRVSTFYVRGKVDYPTFLAAKGIDASDADDFRTDGRVQTKVTDKNAPAKTAKKRAA
ncbi:MAG: YqaJ viral recombinase family protein [Alphaproteobacteria bacterium]|nr:YqaJ viral recombinase family protein [Alphaproteobacteria bacterium]